MRKVLLLLGVLIVVLVIAVTGLAVFLWPTADVAEREERTPKAKRVATATVTPEAAPEPEPPAPPEPEPPAPPEPSPSPATVLASAALPPEAPAVRPTSGTSRRGYCVQLGAFVDPANAERLGETARASGIEVDIVPHVRRGERFHRVRTRNRGSREDAMALAETVRTKLAIEGWITS